MALKSTSRSAEQRHSKRYAAWNRCTPSKTLICNPTQLFTAYCQKQGQDPNSVAFLFDGTRLRPDQTPASEDMEVCRCSYALYVTATGAYDDRMRM